MAALIRLDGAGGRFAVGETCVIGRSQSSHVRFDDPEVSRRHAELRRTPAGYRLVDLSSRFGTFHKGERVQEVLLADGDEIRIGPVRLRFSDDPRPAVSTNSIVASIQVGKPDFRPAGEVETLEQLRRDHDNLRAVVDLSRAVALEHEIEPLLERVLDAGFRLLGTERGCIALVPAGAHGRTIAVSRGDAVLSTSLFTQVVATRAALLSHDVVSDERLRGADSLLAQGVRSTICVPLLHADEVLGVVQLDSISNSATFTRHGMELFCTVATHAAAGVKRALAAEHLRARLIEDQKRLQRLVDLLPAGVALLDAEGRPALRNDRGGELLAALGAPAGSEPIDALQGVTVADLQRGHPIDLSAPGAIPRLVEVSAASDDDTGECALVLRDVTAARQAEAEEAHRERLALVGRLASSVAHDFNNLIAIIRNYATFAADEGADRASVREDLHEVEHAADRAAELAKQLLALSQPRPIKAELIALPHFLGEMDKLLRRALGSAIALAVHAPASLPPVRLDGSRLGQIVMNLAVNARDAMPLGGELRIEAQAVELAAAEAARAGVAAGPFVQLRIADQGSGIPPEIAARIFEPFFTTKEAGSGTGLGLTTVHAIVREAGGAISVESTPGVGTAFEVLLPACAEAAAAAPLEKPLVARGGSETVLAVDDDPAICAILQRTLHAAGYRVLAARSGPEALELARASSVPIDLLLTDLMMPRMSGKQLAQSLRAASAVLYLSGYFDASTQALIGGERLLPKPFTRAELLLAVREALDARDARMAATVA
jgi:signal transduction histidine kinase/ActR/RegA family two-component response regulator